jgi:hypothetical protein
VVEIIKIFRKTIGLSDIDGYIEEGIGKIAQIRYSEGTAFE